MDDDGNLCMLAQKTEAGFGAENVDEIGLEVFDDSKAEIDLLRVLSRDVEEAISPTFQRKVSPDRIVGDVVLNRFETRIGMEEPDGEFDVGVFCDFSFQGTDPSSTIVLGGFFVIG